MSLLQLRVCTSDVAHLGEHESDRVVRNRVRVAPHRVKHGDALLRCRRDIHILDTRAARADDAAFLCRCYNLCIDRRVMCDDDIDIADMIEDLHRRLSCRRSFLLALAAQEPELLIACGLPVHTRDFDISQYLLDGGLQTLG